MSSTCRADAESERHQSNRQDEIDSASATRRSRPHVALEHTALALLPLLPLLPPHPCSRGAILRATPARRVSDARAEVVRDAAAALLQPEQGGGVPLGQVDLRDVSRTRRAHAPPAARRCLGRAYHVDVVPHASAVGRRVIVTEDGEARPLADGDLGAARGGRTSGWRGSLSLSASRPACRRRDARRRGTPGAAGTPGVAGAAGAAGAWS